MIDFVFCTDMTLLHNMGVAYPILMGQRNLTSFGGHGVRDYIAPRRILAYVT